MADMHSLAERLYYTNRRDYTVREGEVAYLDGSPLQRPLKMPLAQKVIAFAIVAVAIIAGAYFVNSTVVSTLRQAERAEQAIADNLQREASIATVPKVASLINDSDDDVRAAFQDAGFSVYDASATSDANSLVLYKLPADMAAEDAAVLYAQGIGNLTAEQASRLLVGSWRFDADRVNGTSMVVHYADFETGDPEIAVKSALEAQGIEAESVDESGVDDSGNTYSQGSVEVDGTNCSWKISAIPLDDMYSVAGLPEEACYVGIRVTAA